MFAGVFLWSDENECEDEFACDEDEYCMNTDGSYKCIGKLLTDCLSELTEVTCYRYLV